MGYNARTREELVSALHEAKLRIAGSLGIERGMKVVDAGCGEGGFTVCIARLVGESGKVVGIDLSNEYLKRAIGHASRSGMTSQIEFKKADIASLMGVVSSNWADMVVAYRFLEDLENPPELSKIMEEIVRITKPEGRVSFVELSTGIREPAEDVYLSLHRDIHKDYFHDKQDLVSIFRRSGLAKVTSRFQEMGIWLSPELAKQGLHPLIREQALKSLGEEIEKYGMKHPSMIVVSGTNTQGR